MTRRITKFFLFLLLFLIPGHLVEAAWLTNVPQEITQPNGTVLHCFATGDEFYNWLHDANNFTILQHPETGYYVYAGKQNGKLVPTSLIAGVDDPRLGGLIPGINISGDEVLQLRNTKFQSPQLKNGLKSAAIGTMNNIVIFIRFSDQTEYTTSFTSYNTNFNGANQVSVRDYYQNVSNNQLTINSTFYPTPSGTTIVSYQDANVRDYYRPYNATTNTIGYQDDDESKAREHNLLKNAVDATRATLEATGLDFDYDNDGYVDNISFVIRGGSDGWSDLLWPHRWSLHTLDVRISTLRVWGYIFMLADNFSTSTTCHEMSHAIGAPDLYHYSQDGLNPVGSWDLMEWNASPPQQMGAYIKWKYFGWYTSIPEITTSGTFSLSPLSISPFECYKIASPNSATEFFLVEYRKKEGRYEISLPGSGLIIYRIIPGIDGNSQGPPDEVYAYRPGGTPTENGNVNSANYSSETGRTAINATTDPTPFLNNNSPGGLDISNIGSAGGTISFTVAISAPAPDLIITNQTTTPSSLNPGETIDISCRLVNQGLVAAGASKIRFYLSTDQTKDVGDVEISNGDMGAVNPGGYLMVTGTAITIPSNTTPGNYYTLFVADADNAVNESNENNNLSYNAITINGASTFNPPRNLAANVTGTSVTLTWQAPNSGSSGTLSGFKIFRDGSLISTSTTPTLLTYSDTGLAVGTYSYYVTATYTSTNGESAASNQVSATISAAPQPDLIITNQSITPTSLFAGAAIDISCRLVNQGTASADASTLRIYLSPNQTYEINDIELASGSMPSINPGSYLTGSGEGITIPGSTSPGNYYILFRADADGTVTESNENNNVSYSSLTVNAPLVFNSPRNLAASVVFNNVTLTWATPGAGSSGTLSGFNVYRDGSLISASTTPTLLTYTDTGLALGSYTYYVTATYVSVNGESSASNQVSATISVIPMPDLVITNQTITPSTLLPGETIDTSCRVENQGTSSASSSTLRIYLSSNQTYESGDVQLSSGSIQSINAGSYSEVTMNGLVIPISTSPGSYFVLMIADADDSVTESVESNNVSFIPVSVLQPPVFNPPTNLSAGVTGNSVLLTWDTPLTGSTGTLSGFNIYRDGTLLVNLFDPGTLTWSESGLTLGTFQYVVTATYTNSNGESVASNQISVVITVISRPDLIITSPAVNPNTIDPGETINISCRLENQGLIDDAGSTIRIYLSANQTYQPNDELLAFGNMGSVNAGSYLMVSVEGIIISATTGPGEYQILFVADADGQVQEMDESNNVAFASLIVNDVSGINEFELSNDLLIYPLPADHRLHLKYSGKFIGPCQITIVNILGKVISSVEVIIQEDFEYEWDVATWTNGFYFVRINNGKEESTRLITIAH